MLLKEVFVNTPNIPSRSEQSEEFLEAVVVSFFFACLVAVRWLTMAGVNESSKSLETVFRGILNREM
jgi:hypothetical protein